MRVRFRNFHGSPLSHLLLPLAALIAVDGSGTGAVAGEPTRMNVALPVAALGALNAIDGLTIEESDDGSTTLRLQGTKKPTFTVYRLSDPERLVVDISGSERGRAVPHAPVDTWAVGRVTVDSVTEKGAKLARIVLDLKRDASYIVVPTGKQLVVTVTPREVPPEAYFARKTAGQRKAELEAMRREAEAYQARASEHASQANAAAAAAEGRARAAEKSLRELEVRAKEQTARADRDLAEAEKRVAEARAKVRDAETADRMSARQRRKLEEARAELERARKDLEAQTATMRTELAAARAERDAARREAEQARERIAAEVSRMKAAGERDLAARRRDVEAQLQRMQLDGRKELEDERQRLRAELAQLQAASRAELVAEREKLDAERKRVERELASVRQQSEAVATSERKKLEAERKRVDGERKRVETELAALRAQSEAQASKERQKLEAERKQVEAELVALRRQNEAELSKERKKLEAERKRVETELAALREQNAAEVSKERQKLEGERKRVEADLARVARETSAAGRKELESHKQRLEQELAVLRASAQDESAASRRRAEDLLMRAELAMSEAREQREQAARARTEAEKALADSRRSHKSTDAGKSAALERAVAQAESAERAAKARQKEAETRLAALAHDRAELEKKLAAQHRRSETLEARIVARRGELDETELRVASARRKLAELGGAVTRAEVEAAQAQAKRAHATATVLEKEVSRLRAASSAAESRADAAEASVRRLERKRARVEGEELATARRLAAAERKQADEAAAQLQSRRTKLAQVATELAGKQAQASALESQLAGLEAKSAGLKRDNKRAREELARAEAELARVQSTLSSETSRLDALHGEVKRAQDSLDATLARSSAAAPSLSDSWERERAAAGAAKVKDVRFEDSRDESRVVIDLDGPMVYAGADLTSTMKLLKLSGAKIPKQLERSLDASAYQGPVRSITSFREGDDVKIIVATQEESRAVLEEKQGQLIWKFPRRRAAGKPEVVSMAGSKVGGFASPPAPLAFGEPSFGRRAKWRGERIDIELQDAPIKDVLLLFSDIGRVNIIAGQGVQGIVTMRLTSVPWDQALDIILKSLGLGMVQEGNVIRVATLADLEEERRKAIEQANAQVQLKPLETRLVPLSYATVGDMIPKVQTVLSSRGSVTPDTRTNTLIIMDVAENIALAEQLVGQLDSQTPQVLIEARIVEARTNWLRQLGIQWGFDYRATAATGNPTGLLFPNALGAAGGASGPNADRRGLILPPGLTGNPNYAVDLPAPVGQGAGGAIGFTFGSISGNLNTNLRLSAAEDEGEVRIISAPKIVTLDNNQAQIEQGVQIPISQVSAQGVNTRYVRATLALRVTPHVTNEGSVLLDVEVQKNEADFINTGARGDPTILTKQAQSQMLITDGDTAVIGGIYTRNQSVNRKKVPWLADIPVIGWFFKNKAEADTRSEVLIFLTPKIVNRAASNRG